MSTDSPEDRERVRRVIHGSIRSFLCNVGTHGRFRMRDLTEFVTEACGTAPDSPGRILRQMKQRGEIDYSCERSQSLYTFLGFP